MNVKMDQIEEKLFSLMDETYREFSSSLMPTVPKERVIGVRIPDIRRLAGELPPSEAKAFMSSLPHKYFEENNLHAFLIAKVKKFDECIALLDDFLPHIDNWATCDSLRPKCFKENTDLLIPHIEKWLKSHELYTVRFGIEMLMVYYLDKQFDNKYLQKVANIKSDEYYINMMIAWYFATALAKQYDDAVRVLENNTLSPWVHNKTISKACESYRVTEQKKKYLKTLKR